MCCLIITSLTFVWSVCRQWICCLWAVYRCNAQEATLKQDCPSGHYCLMKENCMWFIESLLCRFQYNFMFEINIFWLYKSWAANNNNDKINLNIVKSRHRLKLDSYCRCCKFHHIIMMCRIMTTWLVFSPPHTAKRALTNQGAVTSEGRVGWVCGTRTMAIDPLSCYCRVKLLPYVVKMLR